MRVNPGSVGHRPRTGSIPGRYDTFLDPIEMYLETHTIPGAGIALSVPGDSILTSGMGWESLDRRIPVEPESLFRIASLSKPLTAAAVRILVDTSDITLDSPVLQYLDVEPTTGVPADPRFADITIRHLLTHRGGWNRRETSDPMLAPRVVVGEMGIELPPSERDIARYLLGRDLAFTPGTETAYANVGYLLLGILIEDVSGQGYQEFVRESVLDRAGVDPLNLRLGRTIPEDRPRREVSYVADRYCRDVTGRNRLFRAPCPDGGFLLEPMAAHGGHIATAGAYARFFATFDIDGRPHEGIPSPGTVTGALPGSTTVAFRTSADVGTVVLCNRRTDRMRELLTVLRRGLASIDV